VLSVAISLNIKSSFVYNLAILILYTPQSVVISKIEMKLS